MCKIGLMRFSIGALLGLSLLAGIARAQPMLPRKPGPRASARPGAPEHFPPVPDGPGVPGRPGRPGAPDGPDGMHERPFGRARSVFRYLDRDGDDRLGPGELAVPAPLVRQATGRDGDTLGWKDFTPFIIRVYSKWCVFRSLGGRLDRGVDPRSMESLAGSMSPREAGREASSPVGWAEFLDRFRERGPFPLCGFNLMVHFDPLDGDQDGKLTGPESAAFGKGAEITVAGILGALEEISPRGLPVMMDFGHDADGDMRLDAKEAAEAGIEMELEDTNRDGVFSIHDLMIPEPTPAPSASAPPPSVAATEAPESPVAALTPEPSPSPTPRPSPVSPVPTASPHAEVTTVTTSSATSTPPRVSEGPPPTPPGDPVEGTTVLPWLLGLGLLGGLVPLALSRRKRSVTEVTPPPVPAEDPDWAAAQVQFRQQKFDRAAALLQKVIRREGPQRERARGLLIETFLKMKLPDEAARMAADYRSDDLDVRHLYSIADGFDRAGLTPQALQFFRQVIDRDAAYRDCASRLRRLSEGISQAATRPIPVEAPPKSDPIPGLDGRYSDPVPIGMGGMGFVYKVFDAMLDRHIAIKVMHDRMLEDPTARRRFIREVRALGQLSHPHILPIYDVTLDPIPRYSMPLLSGRDLASIVETGELPIEDRLRIAREIAEALSHAHSHEILHRDIKPRNIFVTDEGKAYLLDFGLAQIEDTTRLTQDGMLVGSISYLSPELLQGDPPSRQSDIYSLGVALHELFTGRKPPQAILRKSDEHSRSLRDTEVEIAPELERLLQRCLAPEPADRLRDVDEIVRILADLEDAKRGRGAGDGSRGILVLACRIEGLYRMRIHTLKNMAGVIQRYRSQPESAAERFFRPENLERVLELVGDDLKEELESISAARGTLAMDHLPDLVRAIDGIAAVKDSLIKLPQTIEEMRGQPVATRVTVLEKWYRAFLALSDVLLKALGSLEVDPGLVIERASRIVAGQLEVVKELPPGARCRHSHPERMAKDLETVFENLLQNALQSGARTLTLRGEHSTNHSHLVMNITNDGPPIPEAVASRIFHEAVTTRPGGRGTGLTGCREILESYGGRLMLVTRDPVTFQLALDRGFLDLAREADAGRKEGP